MFSNGDSQDSASARDYLNAFLDTRWSHHRGIIRVQCPDEFPLSQLSELGRLPRNEGIQACLRYIRAPHIAEEISEALWEDLATRERGSDFAVVDEKRLQDEVDERHQMAKENVDRWYIEMFNTPCQNCGWPSSPDDNNLDGVSLEDQADEIVRRLRMFACSAGIKVPFFSPGSSSARASVDSAYSEPLMVVSSHASLSPDRRLKQAIWGDSPEKRNSRGGDNSAELLCNLLFGFMSALEGTVRDQ